MKWHGNIDPNTWPEPVSDDLIAAMHAVTDAIESEGFAYFLMTDEWARGPLRVTLRWREVKPE